MVVHKKYIAQIDTFKNIEILNEDFLVLMLNEARMLSEESMLNKYSLGVNNIDDRVGVPLMTGCKYCNFKVLIHPSQTFMSVRPSVKPAAMTFVALRI